MDGDVETLVAGMEYIGLALELRSLPDIWYRFVSDDVDEGPISIAQTQDGRFKFSLVVTLVRNVLDEERAESLREYFETHQNNSD